MLIGMRKRAEVASVTEIGSAWVGNRTPRARSPVCATPVAR
jgi:hypothetical protein